MHRPVLVTPPEMLPVSLAEAKAHLRVDIDDEDDLIEGLIAAAVGHLDGWTGILGRCLVEQEWRQDFDGFSRCLPLPLGPVISVSSVTHRSPNGTLSTVATSLYALMTDAGGQSYISFDQDYVFPTDLHENKPVSVTYKAGYETIPEVPGEAGPPVVPTIPAKSTVPAPIAQAIKLLVGLWYENRETTIVGNVAAVHLPVAVDALIAPYRKVNI